MHVDRRRVPPRRRHRVAPHRLRRGFQYDDRDLAGSLPLVVGEARIRGLLRAPDAFPLVPDGNSGDQLDLARTDLRLDLRMGEQVVVPVGVSRAPPLDANTA